MLWNSHSDPLMLRTVFISSSLQFEKQLVMKRKSASQSFANLIAFRQNKDFKKEHRSPKRKKTHSKGKPQVPSFSHIHSIKPSINYRQQFCKQQVRGQSGQSSTNCTYTRKKARSGGQKAKVRPKHKKDVAKMTKGEVWELLNTYATKIQKHWRAYRLRKHSRESAGRQSREGADRQHNKRTVYCQEVNVDFYKHQQPQHCESSHSEVNNQYNSSKYHSSSSLVTPHHQNNNYVFPCQNSSNGSVSVSVSAHSLNSQKHATSEPNQPIATKQAHHKSDESLKKCQLESKVYQLRLQEVTEKKEQPPQVQAQVQAQPAEVCKVSYKDRTEQPFIHSSRNPFDFMVKKCKSALKGNKLKQLLELENQYIEDKLSERSYKERVWTITKKHDLSLKELLKRQDKIKNNWLHMRQLYQDNHVDDLLEEHYDSEMSQWDFSESSKKSINHRQEVSMESVKDHFEVGKQHQSIQLVLNQLEEIENTVSPVRKAQHKPFSKKQPNFDDDELLETLAQQPLSPSSLSGEEHIFSKIEVDQKEQVASKIKVYQENSPIKGLQQHEQQPLLDSQTFSAQNKKEIHKIKELADILVTKQRVSNFTATLKICAEYIKSFRKQQMAELKRYAPISCHIDDINNWLLDIAHFLLDNRQGEMSKKLLSGEQPSPKYLLACSRALSPLELPYEIINQKFFKEFEFLCIKNQAQKLQISSQRYDKFSTLQYCFHRSLFQLLNQTMLQELPEGKHWLKLPWISRFQAKKIISPQYTKQSMERAINRVSHWGEYSMAPINDNFEIALCEKEWRQYQEEKMNLIIKEEVMDIRLDNDFYLTSLLLDLSTLIFQEELNLVSEVIRNKMG